MRILIHNMKDTNPSREHFRSRFEQILNSYPHTISLFKKTELEEIFRELFSLWVTLSQTHKMEFVRIKMGDILLKRADPSIFKRKPCHKLYHPIFGTVFELETYKNEPSFLLTKSEAYLDKIDKVLGKNYPGVGTLKKELKSGDQFMNGSFFELETDVLLLTVLSKPYFLKEKIVRDRNESDVDFIGNWDRKSLKFEVKSLCHSPKIIRTGSVCLDGFEIHYDYFKQDRKNRVKDVLLEASEKFREGDFNFVIIPDANRTSELINSFRTAVEELNSGNPELSKKIVSVITYRTYFDSKKPWNKDATLIEVSSSPSWIDAFLGDFRSAKI